MNIIQTNNLTKKFGSTVVVDDISINVRVGEIYGFLGLNGAGKTTTIRLLLGLIKPDSGSILMFGQNVKQASQIWNDIGYLVETPYSYPNLTVRENIEVYYRLRGLNNIKLIDGIINTLQLDQYKDTRAKYLSLGNYQRLGLAKALVHNPKLLILDEPINGLDPAGIVEIREFLKDLANRHNTTIFLSSHILSEISKLATRIGIVHKGKLIKEINQNELEHQIIKKLCLNTQDNHKALKILTDKGYTVSMDETNLIKTSDHDAIQRPELIATILVNSGLSLKMLNVFEEDLETYFLRIIGNKKS